MTAIPRWLREAYNCIGIHEHTDDRDIVGFAREAHVAGVKTSTTPWCAIFTSAMLERSGTASARTAWARNYLRYGQKTGPRIGAIVVLSRGGSSDKGHVGFVVDWDDDTVDVLGGNQGDSVCVKTFPRSRVLGFRWPLTAEALSPVRSYPRLGPVEAEQALRTNGSRTIKGSDRIERIVGTTVVGSGVLKLVSTAGDQLKDLLPAADQIKLAADFALNNLWLVAGVVAVAIVVEVYRIRQARTDDAITGANIARIDADA